MDALKNTLWNVMSGYAVEGLNGSSVLTVSTDHSVFSIVSTANVQGQRLTTTSLIVRIEKDQVLIEHDINNKPLVDALVQVGVPRDKIILTYKGESIPAAV